jgi:hypothetical protein
MLTHQTRQHEQRGRGGAKQRPFGVVNYVRKTRRYVPAGYADFMVFAAQALHHGALVGAFVKLGIVKPERKGLKPVASHVSAQSGDE